ncbi:MAG: nucleoside triphosphate pyrophosphohydrolase [Bacteroidales bacterium]|nr:nucleoside triphosphate pyrophosphohydrolase [Bacteroidales bacterium]
MHTREEKLQAFGRLLDIMDKVREGCPWDRKQTFESLRPQTVEEVYELSGAIMDGKREEICKELGDVLLHVVFYARLGQEENAFDAADVCDRISDKLVYRHPHIFSDVHVDTAEDVSRNWEMLKTKEKGGNKTVLEGTKGLPTLLKAYRMQDKARGVGFDWEVREQVWDKVVEELGEYRDELDAAAAIEARAASDEAYKASEQYAADKEDAMKRAEGECGDFLFSVINAARLYKINPDNALERTCEKFRRRFTYLEEHTIRKGLDLHDMTLAQMDAIWDEAKAKGL